MSDYNFDQIVKDSFVKGGKASQERKRVMQELEKLGGAFMRFVEEKFHLEMTVDVSYLPPLPSAIEAGFSESNACALSLVSKRNPGARINILACSFGGTGAYPCVFTSGDETVVCLNVKRLKSSLEEVCNLRGRYILEKVQQVKKEIVEPSANFVSDMAPASNNQENAVDNDNVVVKKSE